MSDNPLAGLQIPSLEGIAEEIVGRMGNRSVDLSNPLQRHRLKQYIENAIEMAINFELEQALHAATDKAITHVFKIMRDEEYQKKRATRLLKTRERRAKMRAAKEVAEREARLEDSKSHLQAVISVKETIQ